MWSSCSVKWYKIKVLWQFIVIKMSGSSCSIFGCINKFKKGGNISLHLFPKDPDVRSYWSSHFPILNFPPLETTQKSPLGFKTAYSDREHVWSLSFHSRVPVNTGDRTYLSSGMHLARSPISPLRAAILTSSLRFVCFISLAFRFISDLQCLKQL